MNAERRIQIKSLSTQIGSLVRELVAISEAERAAFERTPEGLQFSQRATDSDDAWQGIDDLANTISGAAAELEQIVDAI